MPCERREWCVEKAAALPPADDQPHRSVALLIPREQDDLKHRVAVAQRTERESRFAPTGLAIRGRAVGLYGMSTPEYASLDGRSLKSVLGPPARHAHAPTHALAVCAHACGAARLHAIRLGRCIRRAPRRCAAMTWARVS